jgi:hypothetical protein
VRGPALALPGFIAFAPEWSTAWAACARPAFRPLSRRSGRVPALPYPRSGNCNLKADLWSRWRNYTQLLTRARMVYMVDLVSHTWRSVFEMPLSEGLRRGNQRYYASNIVPRVIQVGRVTIQRESLPRE